jgi:hypothetical protein
MQAIERSRHMKAALGTLTVVLLGALMPTDARADHRYDRAMHQLGTAIELAADDLKDEVDHHFRHRHDYTRLRQISRKIEDFADHIERIVDRHESPQHIYADLAEIDRQVHAFEDILRRSDRHAGYHGEHGYEKLHVHEVLHRLTDLVHEMRDHLDRFARVSKPGRSVVVPVPRPEVVHRDRSRGGISLGGQWGSVNFRF